MEVPSFDYLNAATAQERHISKRFPEFYKYLIDNYPHDIKFSEKLYWYYKGLKDYPSCRVCGKRTAFTGSKTGYREFCSYDCMNKCNDIQQRKKLTSLKHYGVENPMKDESVRKKLEETNIKKFGVKNPFCSDSIKQKIRETNELKYGVPYVMQNKDIAKKVSNTNINKSLQAYDHFLSYDDETETYCIKCPHPECDKCIEKSFNTPRSIYRDRILNHSELCTRLLPINFQHLKGSSLELFVRSILDKHNINYETNVRNIIPPKELDIYIPDKKIAIECNGVFWHGDLWKADNYHKNKYQTCLDNGIQLLTIWEDWVINKRDIIESVILSKLGVYNTRLYARQCKIKQVSVKDSNHFLEVNHIQGKCSSQIRLGLYYNDELVSIMTFGLINRMKSKKDANKYELLRFCNLKGYQIVGGASKLLNYFIKQYHPLVIESFSSNDISNGSLYANLGFEKGKINESYWYIDHNWKRYHRTSFTKDAIVKRGWKENKDGWTEREVMQEHGYFKISDSGQTKWVLNIK